MICLKCYRRHLNCMKTGQYRYEVCDHCSSTFYLFLECVVDDSLSLVGSFETEIKSMANCLKQIKLRTLIHKWFIELDQTNPTNTELDLLSQEWKLEGNDLAARGKRFQPLAAVCYSITICTAVSEANLAVAYANRAVVLMGMGYFDDAICDCCEAIKYKYPQSKIDKIYLRLANCAIETHNAIKLEMAIVGLNKWRHETQNVEKYVDRLNTCNRYLQEIKSAPYYEPNPIKYRLADKLIVEKYSGKRGRYIVAGEKIRANEHIMTETAFSFVPVLDPNNGLIENLQSCHNCAAINIFPTPCHTCHLATYCCRQCRDDHKTIHEFECKGYQMGFWSQIGIAHLAFRTFIVGFNGLKFELLRTNLRNSTPQKVFEKLLELADINKQFRYGGVLKLVTNFEIMNEEDVAQYALTAASLTYYLFTYTPFLSKLEDAMYDIMPEDDDWMLLVSSLFMRHMGQMICNGHAITELYANPTEYILNENSKLPTPAKGTLHSLLKSCRMFTAIYPNISILNHSCDPNIVNRFDKTELTIYATRDIGNNSEIFNCYGPNYKLMDRSERRDSLKAQYTFDCECTRCSSTEKADKNFDHCICRKCGYYNNIIAPNAKWDDKSIDEFFTLKCSKCKTDTIFRFDETDYAGSIRSYEEARKLFSIHNQIKEHISHVIIQNVVESLAGEVEELRVPKLEYLLGLAQEFLAMKEYRYGVRSPESLLAVTYLIDLLAFNKSDDLPIDYDRISKFINISGSPRVRNIIVNYIKTYIDKKFTLLLE